MNRNSKIYIAGHTGLVGSAILRCLKKQGYLNFITRTHKELDLTDQKATADFFSKEKPEYVFLAAAKVGGIVPNITLPAQFLYENMQITANIIHQSYLNGVKKLLYLGSSCIYPKNARQPMKEEVLLAGYPEPTNEPYVIAKISAIKMCQSYNRQYGTNFIAVMPASLYGPGDHFDPEKSHVLPTLLRKFHEAKIQNKKEVIAWGTGKPRREFLYIDELAEGCAFMMKNFNPTKSQNEKGPIYLNIGPGKDISIRELANLIKKMIGFKGNIVWDKSKPDGVYRKLLNVEKINKLGWKYKIQLEDGLKKTYAWYLKSIKNGKSI